MKRMIVAAFCLLSIAACKYPDTFKHLEIDGIYSIDLPPYMTKTDALMDGARFQYRNRFRNIYLIIIDVPVSQQKKSFDDYNHDAVQVITNYVKDSTVSAPNDFQLNGLQAREVLISGKVDGEKTFYDHVTVQSPKNFYEICMWTRADRKEKFEADIKKTIASFKEM